MNARYCYWSVVDGAYSLMMQSVIESARKVGVFKDFHIWSDRDVKGAITHRVHGFNKDHYLFKLDFLQHQVRKLNYDYFVWLDADCWFVRNPGDPLRIMQGSPVHASLESDAAATDNKRDEWWDCSLKNYVTLMRFKGVQSRAIYNVNAGFWIVHHDVIESFCRLAMEFWEFAKSAGYIFTEEAPLAYATHMLCGNPYLHTLRATSDVWASDWAGHYNNRFPDGKPWDFIDYFNLKAYEVNPAIVHCMRAKGALLAHAQGKPLPPPGPSFAT
jgi:hypothetical protein